MQFFFYIFKSLRRFWKLKHFFSTYKLMKDRLLQIVLVIMLVLHQKKCWPVRNFLTFWTLFPKLVFFGNKENELRSFWRKLENSSVSDLFFPSHFLVTNGMNTINYWRWSRREVLFQQQNRVLWCVEKKIHT